MGESFYGAVLGKTSLALIKSPSLGLGCRYLSSQTNSLLNGETRAAGCLGVDKSDRWPQHYLCSNPIAEYSAK